MLCPILPMQLKQAIYMPYMPTACPDIGAERCKDNLPVKICGCSWACYCLLFQVAQKPQMVSCDRENNDNRYTYSGSHGRLMIVCSSIWLA